MITIRVPKGLPADKLKATLDPAKIPYATSDDIKTKNGYARFQPRAIQALDLSLRIPGNEYNIYLAGEGHMGRTYFVTDYLSPAAAKAPTPPDWLYLYNFEDEDRPVAVSLPSGSGKKFKAAMTKAMARIRIEVPACLEQESAHARHEALNKRYARRREELFTKMEDAAEAKGFALDMDDSGALTISPVVDDEIIRDAEFEKLDADTRKRLKEEGDTVLSEINVHLRKINKNEHTLKRDELKLNKTLAREALKEIMDSLRTAFGQVEKLAGFLKEMEEDMVDNVEHFLPRDTPPAQGQAQSGPDQQTQADEYFSRFEVNLFVDNSETKGAPIVVEHHPTGFNLLGSIEREAELGALYTDHTLIRAGALHRANNGFLVLNTEDLLSMPASWEGLLRALRAGCSRIEDPVDEGIRTKTIEPESIPLDLKIVLIGTDDNFESLLYHDDRFQKFFKLKAHLQPTAPRNAANIRNYLAVLGRIVRESGLLPFTREAMAGLVDFASRLAEDQKKLSLYFPLVRERMIEASALAAMDGRTLVEDCDLREAVGTRDFRSNLFEEEYMGDYEREVIKVSTEGEAVGMCNGLSVTLFGDYEFGLPHQITCTVGVGHGGILDLEREAQLGGPIHTKGMMIIKSYLVRLFAQNKPIVLTGSLCFEQSYAGIEGDSASGAELASLLSALSGVPNRLGYAFTGAVSQTGAIMAVGGVNRKIEGFYEVCRRRGFTGEQGVLFPADNAVNLMLKDEIVQAVREGRFHLFPVRSIEQALGILTGVAAGALGKGGTFPAGTIYHLVDQRLAELARLAREFGGAKP
ncbi:MAG: AAA family ATPase [Proteobacteria bacterium]|nr:AAA family ATPase [Pseudomonadota bacterium]